MRKLSLVFLWAACFTGEPLAAGNGFDLTHTKIPRNEILAGGPPKDGIPAIDSPKFVKARDTHFLTENDTVIGVRIAGRVKAYPLRILMWHEVVNDTVSGIPIVVTYCPLCNSAFVFERRFSGRTYSFGVSGLLYNSNVLLYDRNTESLWSQGEMKAVAGPAARRNLKLKLLPAAMMKWSLWRKQNPGSLVLSTNTGYRRDYNRTPYGNYFTNDELYFPVKMKRSADGFTHKAMTMLVVTPTGRRLFICKQIAAQLKVAKNSGRAQSLRAKVGEDWVKITLEKGNLRARYTSKPGSPATAYLYWFLVRAIYPKVEVYGQ